MAMLCETKGSKLLLALASTVLISNSVGIHAYIFVLSKILRVLKLSHSEEGPNYYRSLPSTRE
jgi:hypothetical protein